MTAPKPSALRSAALWSRIDRRPPHTGEGHAGLASFVQKPFFASWSRRIAQHDRPSPLCRIPEQARRT